MADRLSWWVIPGALVVLLNVASWANSTPPSAPGKPPAGERGADLVVVRDASGERAAPVPHDVLTAAPLVLAMPAALVGQRGAMTVWRRIDGVRDQTPWLTLRARVRSDATIALAGLAAGRYDLELTFAGEPAATVFAANDVQAPGEVALVAAAPLR